MPNKIKKLIQDICKENDIQYTSKSDAKRLGELISELNIISDEVYQILDRHNIKTTLKQEIEDSLLTLHAVDHELIYLAEQLRKRND
jgi:ribosomal protein L7Ae-like RNA K-turn-binding protein